MADERKLNGSPSINKEYYYYYYNIFAKLKEDLMATFSRNALTSISSLVAIVIKGLIIWGSKCHQNNSPVVCDDYVKYEEAEVDRLVAILKTNNCVGGGGGPCGIQ